MKKLLAALSALMLAFSITPSLAEEASTLVFAQVDDGFSQMMNTPETQQVHQAILDQIQVDVRPMFYPLEQYGNRVNMALAAGDQMDLICRVDLSQAKEWLEAGIIIDLTQFLEEKVPNYAAWLAQSELSAKAREETRVNGKDVGIPMVATMQRATSFSIRTDWLKALNMDTPATVDEFEAYLEAVKTQDPDGNGADDTYGLCGAIWGGNVLNCLATSYLPAGANWWLDENGVLQHPGLHPNYKAMLARLIDWQEKGYLPPEALLSADDQRNDWLINNQLGAVAGWYSAPIAGRTALVEKAPDAWYEPINLVGLPDAANALPNERAYSSLICVTSSCKDLDAVARYFNLSRSIN